MFRFATLAATVALILAAAPAALASTFTIGAKDDENCFPFGCNVSVGTVYQQLYSSSAFSGPASITAVSFQSDPSLGGTVSGGNFTLSASTTSTTLAGINEFNFASNIGANNTVVFSGGLSAHFVGGVLTIPFSTPFFYDPAAGNLLLNFNISGLVPGGAFFDSNDGTSTVYSRAQNFGSSSVGWGLVTTFDTAVSGVPEPAMWGLMVVGFGIAGTTMRRRRTASLTA